MGGGGAEGDAGSKRQGKRVHNHLRKKEIKKFPNALLIILHQNSTTQNRGGCGEENVAFPFVFVRMTRR